VYDLQGRLVRTLVQEDLQVGEHLAIWNGRSDRGRTAASGIYFARLTAAGAERTIKLMLVK
jgi:hypothetical protein